MLKTLSTARAALGLGTAAAKYGISPSRHTPSMPRSAAAPSSTPLSPPICPSSSGPTPTCPSSSSSSALVATPETFGSSDGCNPDAIDAKVTTRSTPSSAAFASSSCAYLYVPVAGCASPMNTIRSRSPAFPRRRKNRPRGRRGGTTTPSLTSTSAMSKCPREGRSPSDSIRSAWTRYPAPMIATFPMPGHAATSHGLGLVRDSAMPCWGQTACRSDAASAGRWCVPRAGARVPCWQTPPASRPVRGGA